MSDSDETYPQDFTEPAPGQLQGWLSKKSRSILKKRYLMVWCELDELNQSFAYFSNESSLGPFKSERLGTFPLDNSEITSGISKKGRFFITIRDKTRKKYIFVASSFAEHKKWLDALERTRSSPLTSTNILGRWVDDSLTLERLQIAADAMLSLDDSKQTLTDTTIDTPTTERSLEEDDSPSESEEKDLQKALYSKYLLDPEGSLTMFGDVLHGQITLVYFLRHFGCILMRTCVQELIDKKELLERCGIRLVAIGNGTPEMAREFLKEYPFPGRIFVDPEKKLYEAMHCKHGVKYALSEDVLRYTRAACERAAHRQSGIQGDPLQLGGVFVISPTKGMVYRRLENYIGSTTDMPNLIPFITEYAYNHPETTWQSRDPSDPDATSSTNKDFQLSYYKDHFIHQVHTIYVLPQSEATGSPVISAVLELKQSDKKALAFHMKGKTKLYQPCYLTDSEFFDHTTRRIFGAHIEGFVKIPRTPAAVDRLCDLEDTMNKYFAAGETGPRLEQCLAETVEFLLRK
jgi:hypothetical protein